MTTFLKRMELQGFKSFAQKTVLEFPEKVTAVVGPNGSGKSNVIDAFRWVLGEREAKSLRGETLEHLMFAGNPSRPAASLAKVTLYFDNRDKLFPLDGEEVMLSRKVDRSGTSTFFLHDTEIKLKDLLPLLARARLGSRGLTMIGQGQSDIFVRCSPEERRAMIEEVLGLREFRLKRINSERQLKSSEANMEKVKAMIDEIEPHLKFLRKQKTRWDKRSEIELELRALLDTFFAIRLKDLHEAEINFNSPRKTLESAREKKIAEIKALEVDLASFDTSHEVSSDKSKELREEISKLLRERQEVEKSAARLEAKLELEDASGIHTSSLGDLQGVLKQILSEIDKVLTLDSIDILKQSLVLWKETIEKALHGKKKENVNAVSHEDLILSHKKIQELDEQIVKREKEAESLFDERDRRNIEFRTRVQNLEEQKNSLRKTEGELERLLFEKERVELRKEELVKEWVAFGRERNELEHIHISHEIALSHDEMMKKILRFRGELAAIGEIDEGLVKEADETEVRYGFLMKEYDDLIRASADLKNLIRELEERIHKGFKTAFKKMNEEFNTYFKVMFNGGKAKLTLEEQKITSQEGVDGEISDEPPREKMSALEHELRAGVEIEVQVPRKRIASLEMLSGGEKSLVSMAALFALIAVSPPPFLVLDEMDAALDEENARRFAELVREFSKKTQFIIVTHNRSTMEAANVLYGVTMADDGVSKVLSLKLE